MSESDLHLFFQTMGIVGMDTPVTVVGFNNQSNPGVEANLDIQYIMGVARGVPTTVWSIYANSTVEIDDILKWGYQVGNVTNPPLVNSLSYGMTESHVNECVRAMPPPPHTPHPSVLVVHASSKMPTHQGPLDFTGTWAPATWSARTLSS